MKTIDLQQKCIGGLSGPLDHYLANGERVTYSQFIAIKNEAINYGKYIDSWQSNHNGIVIFNDVVSVRENFNY